MTAYEVQCRKFHSALHRLCGYPALAATMADLIAWHTFLTEMKPLAETEDGPFTVADLTAVLALMAKQKRDGIGWSMRPSKIIRDPEPFRDLVLEARRELATTKRRRNPPPLIQRLPNGTTRRLDDRQADPPEIPLGKACAEEFAKLRKAAGI